MCRIGVVEFPGDFLSHGPQLSHSRQKPSKHMLTECNTKTYTLSNMNCCYIHLWYRDICIQTCWLVNNNSSPITMIIVHDKMNAIHYLKAQVSCRLQMLSNHILKESPLKWQNLSDIKDVETSSHIHNIINYKMWTVKCYAKLTIRARENDHSHHQHYVCYPKAVQIYKYWTSCYFKLKVNWKFCIFCQSDKL